MDNLTIILEEYELYKGQFIIITDKVERLIAIGDDGEDWYYLTWDGHNITWCSCVVGITPLKGYIREEDYNRMISIAKHSHYDQIYGATEWEEQWNKQRSAWGPDHKLLTPICWDLI